MESLAARKNSLTSRYNINLGHKPSNPTYAKAKSLFHPTESFPKRSTPCLIESMNGIKNNRKDPFLAIPTQS